MTHAHQHGGTARGHDPAGLVPVDEHLADVTGMIRPLAPVKLALAEAEGCVLASDVTAGYPLPSFDNSAMDGYAVRAADVTGATERSPVTLPVTGQVTAGDTGAYELVRGASVRVMTGAQLPAGADAVVPVEWTDDGDTKVAIRQAAQSGHAVRLAGDDARAGEVLLRAGTVLGPAQLGLVAAAGGGVAVVRPRPRVVVISTGNELAEPGSPLTPGKIWESNSFMLAAAARQAGCLACRSPVAPDEPRRLLETIESQLPQADLLVTSGGVSMGGPNDVVKDVLQGLGTVTFRKVAMQPGMPQGFGVVGPDATPIITLPGNPVSAYVSFQVFVRAALEAMLVTGGLRLPVRRAVLSGPLKAPPGRRAYLRGVLDAAGQKVAPLGHQGSHQLATLGRANALVIVPEQVTAMAEGDEVDVMSLP